MAAYGITNWDSALARQLYDQPLPYQEIGRQVGTTGGAIRYFAERHGWPARERVIKPPGKQLKAKALKPGQSTLPPLSSLS